MNSEELWTRKQAAEYLNTRPQQLAVLAIEKNKGRGPAFYKVGRLVRYKKSDLDAWLESNRQEGVVDG